MTKLRKFKGGLGKNEKVMGATKKIAVSPEDGGRGG